MVNFNVRNKNKIIHHQVKICISYLTINNFLKSKGNLIMILHFSSLKAND